MGKASLRQSIRVLQLVDDTGWSAEEISRRLIGHWGLLRDLAVALGTGAVREAQVRRLIGKTFKSLRSACRRIQFDSNFTEENFPLEPLAPDEDDWVVHVHDFDRVVPPERAFDELKRLGYRLLGGSRRAMEFIATYSDPGLVGLDRPLVITVRRESLPGERNWLVPVFVRRGNGRRLDVEYLASAREGYGWLVLKKRVA